MAVSESVEQRRERDSLDSLALCDSIELFLLCGPDKPVLIFTPLIYLYTHWHSVWLKILLSVCVSLVLSPAHARTHTHSLSPVLHCKQSVSPVTFCPPFLFLSLFHHLVPHMSLSILCSLPTPDPLGPHRCWLQFEPLTSEVQYLIT